MSAAETPALRDGRLLSLDVFRGFTIAAMVLVNNPGDWSHIYAPLRHAAWNGWTFTDWIFPFFLFICGVSLTFSVSRLQQTGLTRRRIVLRLWRRAAIIMLIGLALNFIPAFDLDTLRFPGVLQRIGLCVLVAAPIALRWSWRGQLTWAFALMGIYSITMLLLPVPDVQGVMGVGRLEPGRDAGAYFDRLLMGGHLWAQSRTWDPEGLLSTLPAIASLLFGAVAGRWMLGNAEPAAKTVWLMLAGLLALWLGTMLDGALMPINKSLWTPSYAIFVTGWALLLFAASYWLIDGCGVPSIRSAMARCTTQLAMYGVNALFIFAFSGLVAKLLGYVKVQAALGELVSLKAWLFSLLSQLPLSPVNASLLFAVLFNAAMLAVAAFLWRRSIIIKV